MTLRALPEASGLPFRLGRHVEHDERSRGYQAPLAPEASSAWWRHYGHILNQGDIGSCTGNALVQCLVTGPLRRLGWYASEPKALDAYHLATVLDGFDGVWPPDDTGSSGLAACKAGVQLGWITEYRHAFGLDQARRAIAVSPMLCGTAWYESMFEPDADGFVRPVGEKVGGHEYVSLAWDALDGTWTFQNPWGKPWGVAVKGLTTGGAFRMRDRDFGMLLEDSGDLTVPVRDAP